MHKRKTQRRIISMNMWKRKRYVWFTTAVLAFVALVFSFGVEFAFVPNALAESSKATYVIADTDTALTPIDVQFSSVDLQSEPPPCNYNNLGVIWTDPVTGYRFICVYDPGRGYRWVYYDAGGCSSFPSAIVKENC